MARETRPLIQRIEAARAAIVALFVEQCSQGEQTKALGDDRMAACGQFIGGTAKRLSQRGLHGTAAALEVLSQVPLSGEHSALLPRLTRFLAEHLADTAGGNDPKQAEQSSGDGPRRVADANNVIKVSEVLHALSELPESVERAGALKRRLIAVLKKGLIEKKGWPYFLDQPDGGPELLPTAYAIYALAAAGERIDEPVQYLVKQISDASGGNSRDGVGVDINTRVACLYALTFRKGGDKDGLIPEELLRRVFARIWDSLESLLRQESVEQNVEYWRGEQTYYVRIPWQLYLLPLSARLRFYRGFSTFSAQARLAHVLDLAERGRFYYPHSGNLISSRTNAIAFETLGQVLAEVRRDDRIAPSLFYVCDRVRSSRGLKAFIGTAAGILILASFGLWWLEGGSLKELAPNFGASGLLALLALWTKSR